MNPLEDGGTKMRRYHCEHRQYCWYAPLWVLQRADWPSRFPGVVRAIRATQILHTSPQRSVRICLECDEIRLT